MEGSLQTANGSLGPEARRRTGTGASASRTAVAVPVSASRSRFQPLGSPSGKRRLMNEVMLLGGRGIVRASVARSTRSTVMRARSVSPVPG